MMNSRSQQIKARRKKRAKQRTKNSRLKKKLFGHLIEALCCYCQNIFSYSDLTIEHIIPLCLGGDNEENNITLACRNCNQEKGKEAWKLKRKINREKHFDVTD